MALSSSSLPADNYTSFEHLNQLKRHAGKNPADEQVARKVANQFEALFVQMMMKSMRKANEFFQSELSSSSASKTYQDLHDKQFSLNVTTRGNGIGIADQIMADIQKQFGTTLDKANPINRGTS